MDTVTIDGRSFDAVSFPTAHSVVLMIRGGKGFLGCGYLSVATADKTGDALAIVSGVKNYDDMLKAEVKAVSAAAAARFSGRRRIGRGRRHERQRGVGEIGLTRRPGMFRPAVSSGRRGRSNCFCRRR